MRSAEPFDANASTRSAQTESTSGSSARMRGGLSTDARILRTFVWPGGFDSPSCSSSGVRVSSSSGAERRLREALGVAADLGDVLVVGYVEHARHQLGDAGLVTQLREDLFVVVDLRGIERVVRDGHGVSCR